MEWLAIDGQRVMAPHPVDSSGRGDTHWVWIGERLRDFYSELIEMFPDPNYTNTVFPEAEKEAA